MKQKNINKIKTQQQLYIFLSRQEKSKRFANKDPKNALLKLKMTFLCTSIQNKTKKAIQCTIS